MAELKADYRAEIRAMRDRYGETAEVPSPLRDRVATQPIAARIADLAQQAAEAAHMLNEAREQSRKAGAQRATCEARFAALADDLIRAITEHREGTSENVPYQP
jgi:hypothetical protein